MGPLWGAYGALWELYGALLEPYGTLRGPYGGWAKVDGTPWGLEWAPYGEPKCLHFHRKSSDSGMSRRAGAK